MTLEELKLAADAAEATARELRARYHAALCNDFPFKVGDIIKSATGDIARVDNIEIKYGQPRMVAYLRNKDGNFGKRAAPLWREAWDKPERIS